MDVLSLDEERGVLRLSHSPALVADPQRLPSHFMRILTHC